jgi:two-component system, OmpR family, response regulator RegX3
VADPILLVDDEPSVHEVVRAYLEHEGFAVAGADNGRDGLELAEHIHPKLVVLDLMLPDLAGEELCREIRRRSDVPIVMLTAKSSEDARVLGLELGADDYLVKPFSPRELVARIKTVLRRSGGVEQPLVGRLTFEAGILSIDPLRREVRVRGERADLTPSEYGILVTLAQYPGRVYSRFELIDRVRGWESKGGERTIDAHVKNLRRKIEPEPTRPRFVETVHGVGYRMAAR